MRGGECFAECGEGGCACDDVVSVAYRLERVKELTGLDPLLSEDRERLGLGLKAYRIIAPRLHR